MLESKRPREEETEIGDIFEGNGESDSSVGSVSNSRFLLLVFSVVDPDPDPKGSAHFCRIRIRIIRIRSGKDLNTNFIK